ncbi:hypothetical protein JCGZ_25622 [Jatropha curcas]|uniref:Uncharacterized protein n=1 Tax=Jatropha curcas TaxID=180498 RepID=A0A067JK22_JATCU|nr:hypothetical protein JCGZ_25622 [Jatropha curcas]
MGSWFSPFKKLIFPYFDEPVTVSASSAATSNKAMGTKPFRPEAAMVAASKHFSAAHKVRFG